MTARAMRLDPPAVELTAERCWVLLRAFGPPDAAWDAGALDGGGVLAAARALALDARIASRIPHARLEAEIGAEAAGGLVAAYRMAAVQGMLIAGAERVVADAARRAGTAAVLLKFAAVSRLAGLEAGARPACDLDVLVPEGALPALREALAEAEFAQADFHDEAHHVAPFLHPSGAMVELHVVIPAVRLDGRDATHETVVAAGLARRAEGLREGLLLPARELVIAHLLVHGLHQHLLAPESYPLMRMVSDLVDLGVSREESGRMRPVLSGWIGHLVPETLVDAAVGLAEMLSEAGERGEGRGESGETGERGEGRGESGETGERERDGKRGAPGATGFLAPLGMTAGGESRQGTGDGGQGTEERTRTGNREDESHIAGGASRSAVAGHEVARRGGTPRPQKEGVRIRQDRVAQALRACVGGTGRFGESTRGARAPQKKDAESLGAQGGRSDERVLLDHILAGAFDPAYARSLRWPAMVEALRGASGPSRMLLLWHSVVLTRGQVDAIYGGPRSAFGYLGLRVWRPFDVMLRALRYGAAWAMGRVRSGREAARP